MDQFSRSSQGKVNSQANLADLNDKKFQPRKTEIIFKPVSDGLGFHPFSDGLPYAPMAKSPRPTGLSGTGAVVAGKPRIATSLPQLPSRTETQLSSPTLSSTSASSTLSMQSSSFSKSSASTLASPLASGSVFGQGSNTLASPARPSAASYSQKNPASGPFYEHRVSVPLAAPLASLGSAVPGVQTILPLQSQDLQSPLGRSYVAKRVTAYTIDFVLNSVFFFFIAIVLMLKQGSGADIFSNRSVILVTASFCFAFHWFLLTLQEMIFGTSLGKWFLGFSLNGGSLALLLRAVLSIPSILLMGVGVLAGLSHPQKRCWHDSAVGVQPLEMH